MVSLASASEGETATASDSDGGLFGDDVEIKTPPKDWRVLSFQGKRYSRSVPGLISHGLKTDVKPTMGSVRELEQLEGIMGQNGLTEASKQFIDLQRLSACIEELDKMGDIDPEEYERKGDMLIRSMTCDIQHAFLNTEVEYKIAPDDAYLKREVMQGLQELKTAQWEEFKELYEMTEEELYNFMIDYAEICMLQALQLTTGDDSPDDLENRLKTKAQIGKIRDTQKSNWYQTVWEKSSKFANFCCRKYDTVNGKVKLKKRKRVPKWLNKLCAKNQCAEQIDTYEVYVLNEDGTPVFENGDFKTMKVDHHKRYRAITLARQKAAEDGRQLSCGRRRRRLLRESKVPAYGTPRYQRLLERLQGHHLRGM